MSNKKAKSIIILSTILLISGCNENSNKEPKVIIKEVHTTPKLLSQTFYSCEKERGATHIGISSCYEEELGRQDKKLNTAYQKAKKEIQPFRVEELKKVQLEWIKYRDMKCAFFHHRESGQGGATDEQNCLVEETIRRAKELEGVF